MKNTIITKERDPLKLNLMMLVSCAVIFALVTFVLTPIYISVVSDIVVSTTILPDVIEIALDLSDIVIFAIAYSIVIYAATFRSSNAIFKLCITYVIASFIRRSASLLITYVTDGIIISNDIISVILYFVLETVQIVIVAMIAIHFARKHYIRACEVKKAARTTGDFSKVQNIEFTSIFSKANPLNKSMLTIGIILAAIKIITRVVYDINYGAPNSISEILIMAVYYLSDIFVAVIFYALSWLIISRFIKKDSALTDQ